MQVPCAFYKQHSFNRGIASPIKRPNKRGCNLYVNYWAQQIQRKTFSLSLLSRRNCWKNSNMKSRGKLLNLSATPGQQLRLWQRSVWCGFTTVAPGHPVPIPGDTGAQVTGPSPHLLLGRWVQLMGRMGNLLLRVGRRGYQAGIKMPRLRITDLYTKIQDRSLRSLQISKMLSTAKDCDIRTSDTKEIFKKSLL